MEQYMARNRKGPMDTWNISRSSQQKTSELQSDTWNGPFNGTWIICKEDDTNKLERERWIHIAESKQSIFENHAQRVNLNICTTLRKYLRNLTKILENNDKHKDFQLLLKEMKERWKDEKNQFRIRNAGKRSIG